MKHNMVQGYHLAKSSLRFQEALRVHVKEFCLALAEAP